MAIIIRKARGSAPGNEDTPEAHGSQYPAGDTGMLTSALAAYRQRIGRDRRGSFVGVAAVGVGIAWVAAAFGLLFRLEAAYMLGAALALTVALPVLAVALERATRPSVAQTARILDTRMDNQQRLVTALELGSSREPGPLDVAQVETTARYLAAFDPAMLYPVRANRPLLAVATGLLCFALAIVVLKDAGSFVPFQARPLPDITQALAALPSATAVNGLPGSDLTATPTSYAQAAQPSPSAGPKGDQQQSSNGENGQSDAAGRAADSNSAQAGLDKLGQSLEGQSAAQQAADNLRKGNYDQAAKDISDLGTQSDQLSAAAKKDLADALDKAAADPATDPALSRSEQTAADALRKGEYKKVAGSLDDLGKSVQDTAGKVMSQQEMAKAYPSPTAQAASQPQDNAGQSDPNKENGQQSSADKQGSAGGQPGQNDQGGQQGQGQQNGQQSGDPQSGGQPKDGSGQSQQDGQSAGGGQGQSGQEGGQGQQGNSQAGGQDQGGEGQPGAPGDGHRESGPTGSGVQGGAANPFELQGSQPPQANRPGDSDHPALSLEGSGSAGGTAPVAPGSASNVPGENSNIPVERWDVIQRYFSGK